MCVIATIGVIATLLVAHSTVADRGNDNLVDEVMSQILLIVGAVLLGVTSLISTIAMLSMFSTPLATEWKKNRMHDLLMTPMAGRDLWRGFFWGQMLGWCIWMGFATVVGVTCGLIGLWLNPPAKEVDAIGFLQSPVVIGALLVFTIITQTIWAAGVTWAFSSRYRSVIKAQALAILILVIAVPIPTRFFMVLGVSWMWGAGSPVLQLIKGAIGLKLLLGARKKIGERLLSQLETSDTVGG